jgi:hypothetical protein
MPIDYTRVVRNLLGPKLSYFGFKFDVQKSHPPTGVYQFTRHYWGASQSVIIGRVKYTEEDLAAAVEDGDTPAEVPPESLLIKEPGYRSWLSNKYIFAMVCHEGACMSIRPDGTGIGLSFVKAEAGGGGAQGTEEGKPWKSLEWWGFTNQATLTLQLKELHRRILDDGLDWFERQVADVRHYHEKLDTRRKAAAKRRND